VETVNSKAYFYAIRNVHFLTEEKFFQKKIFIFHLKISVLFLYEISVISNKLQNLLKIQGDNRKLDNGFNNDKQ